MTYNNQKVRVKFRHVNKAFVWNRHNTAQAHGCGDEDHRLEEANEMKQWETGNHWIRRSLTVLMESTSITSMPEARNALILGLFVMIQNMIAIHQDQMIIMRSWSWSAQKIIKRDKHKKTLNDTQGINTTGIRADGLPFGIWEMASS